MTTQLATALHFLRAIHPEPLEGEFVEAKYINPNGRIIRQFYATQRELLADAPPDFEPARRLISPLARPQGFAKAKVAKAVTYLVKANWKLVWENNRECYHCNVNHPQYIKANFDHYNAWTQYSLQQVLDHGGFADIRVFGLNLYVFYRNPLNYVAWLWDRLNTLFFRFSFMMLGKSNRLFTKKIAAVARKRAAA